MSVADEPPAAEDGIEEAPSPTPPTKRRTTQDERFPTVQTGELATGSMQTGGPETEQLPTMQTGRRKYQSRYIQGNAKISTAEIDYKCSEAPIILVPLLGDPLFNAVSASNQWKWERRVGGLTTDCMNAMVPEDPSQDISITLSVGHKKGLELIRKFKLAPT